MSHCTATAVLIAGALCASTAAFSKPLGYAPRSGQQLSIFEQIFPERQSIDATESDLAVVEADNRPAHLRRHIVAYQTRETPGTVIIDTPNTHLYYVLGGGKAISYGIGVGREGFTWSGIQSVTRKSEWPDWMPPAEMIQRQPYLPRFVAGGENNPLGARAIYLGKTIYRIHGTNAPETIGSHVSSGCIRMTNDDVVDLYGRVDIGTRVIVMPDKPHREPSVALAERPSRATRSIMTTVNTHRVSGLY
jgi:lipoprotein-anchoring transpeptidase ErfK/SrfK